jgi:hypothetical protein
MCLKSPEDILNEVIMKEFYVWTICQLAPNPLFLVCAHVTSRSRLSRCWTSCEVSCKCRRFCGLCFMTRQSYVIAPVDDQLQMGRELVVSTCPISLAWRYPNFPYCSTFGYCCRSILFKMWGIVFIRNRILACNANASRLFLILCAW